MKRKSFYLIFLFLVNIHLNYAHQIDSRIFVFGTDVLSDNPDKTVTISSPIPFSTETGFGFDYNTEKKIKFRGNAFTSNSPVYFSVKVPEGNYKIEIVLGSNKINSITTIKAESRRLMLREINVEKGNNLTKSFVVNVHTPKIDQDHIVNRKPRELNKLNWDNKLTLEFSGELAVQSITIKPIKGRRTIYLAGDSTVTDQDLEPWASWGQMITQYFIDEIVIANYAASGASLNSFKDRNRLRKILSLIQPGDYLFIEFAHNDEKRKGEGIGPWQSYSHLLTEYITKTRGKGGIPILVTPTQRRAFNPDGTLQPTHGDYPDAMRKVAQKLNVPLIDLTQMTTKMYESWGDEVSRKAFVQYPANTFPGQEEKLEDNTHFSNFGANEIALAVIKGIRDLDLELKEYLFGDAPYYNPSNPNHFSSWTVPRSPRFSNTKPDGN